MASPSQEIAPHPSNAGQKNHKSHHTSGGHYMLKMAISNAIHQYALAHTPYNSVHDGQQAARPISHHDHSKRPESSLQPIQSGNLIQQPPPSGPQPAARGLPPKHTGWTPTTFAMAKCDCCEKQRRRMIQSCNKCSFSICRDCYDDGKLDGNALHEISDDKVKWTVAPKQKKKAYAATEPSRTSDTCRARGRTKGRGRGRSRGGGASGRGSSRRHKKVLTRARRQSPPPSEDSSPETIIDSPLTEPTSPSASLPDQESYIPGEGLIFVEDDNDIVSGTGYATCIPDDKGMRNEEADIAAGILAGFTQPSSAAAAAAAVAAAAESIYLMRSRSLEENKADDRWSRPMADSSVPAMAEVNEQQTADSSRHTIPSPSSAFADGCLNPYGRQPVIPSHLPKTRSSLSMEVPTTSHLSSHPLDKDLRNADADATGRHHQPFNGGPRNEISDFQQLNSPQSVNQAPQHCCSENQRLPSISPYSADHWGRQGNLVGQASLTQAHNSSGEVGGAAHIWHNRELEHHSDNSRERYNSSVRLPSLSDVLKQNLEPCFEPLSGAQTRPVPVPETRDTNSHSNEAELLSNTLRSNALIMQHMHPDWTLDRCVLDSVYQTWSSGVVHQLVAAKHTGSDRDWAAFNLVLGATYDACTGLKLRETYLVREWLNELKRHLGNGDDEE